MWRLGVRKETRTTLYHKNSISFADNTFEVVKTQANAQRRLCECIFSFGKLERVTALPIEIIANWRHVKIKADDYTTFVLMPSAARNCFRASSPFWPRPNHFVYPESHLIAVSKCWRAFCFRFGDFVAQQKRDSQGNDGRLWVRFAKHFEFLF